MAGAGGFSKLEYIGAEHVARQLDYCKLANSLRAAFADRLRSPDRKRYQINHGGCLLLMPAWRPGGIGVVKVSTVLRDNPKQQLPTIQSNILVFDASTGEQLALIDGTEITRRRTAAASVLAAQLLANKNASRLLVVGTGPQAFHQARAFSAAFPITNVAVWGRSSDKAIAMAERLSTAVVDLEAASVADLPDAVNQADIITTATSSSIPLVEGCWLSKATHLDVVGAFSPMEREVDTETVVKSQVFVDVIEGAMREAGDIIMPMNEGAICADDIRGDLYSLASKKTPGRQAIDEITLFKSVGDSIEDLVAAELAIGEGRRREP